MDGSSISSPLESPDAPITSSVVTLQSAESLSMQQRQRQVRPGHETLDTSMPCLVPDLNPIAQQLDRTPDTPSANISSHSSSGVSQAFTSHFTSETSLLPRQNTLPEQPPSPSAILTPSTEVYSDTDGQSGDIEFLEFGDEPWDLSQFDYDLSCLNIDGISQKSGS
ncbi:hypothetical protein NQ315_005331 [Exocentrus adspersus]|uniref:Uncharacterized protein n=1 Tax=Exocentrus adspersus TaxID=1586481 RepID=A0AAV8W1X0_9CUCU|nr:hypothetical protein NQ315_005331 [Exocentrus adspersus]